MKPQDKLITFMKIKSELINKTSEGEIRVSEFFSEEDKKELLSWSDEVASSVMEKVLLYLNKAPNVRSIDKVDDTDICPWCIIHSSTCHSCGYGERHGICVRCDISLYEEVCLTLPENSIVDSISLETLYNLTLSSINPKEK